MKLLCAATLRIARALVAPAAVLAMTATVAAPPHDHAPAAPPWHGDISRFHEHDWNVWRGGRWVHGPHGGHMGWWWVVGGAWYFYPLPVYPYPNPYEPPPAWQVSPPVETAAPPAQFWYYCEASQGYYPYVQTCPGGWKQVPAVPADAASAPAR